MRGQKLLIFALIFALIIAIFSVLNVEAVQVNYLFGKALVPLIIVVIASALTGGLIVGAVGIFRQFSLQREVKLLRRTIEAQLGTEALQEVGRKVKTEQEHQQEQEEETGHREHKDDDPEQQEGINTELQDTVDEQYLEETQSSEQEKTRKIEEK
jgi:putative membrane protein